MQTQTDLIRQQKKIKGSQAQNALDEQFRLLSDVQIRTLQDKQIIDLKKEQIMQLNAQQIVLFSAVQISVFSEEQISVLSEEQITGKQYIGDYWTPEISLNESGISSNSRGLSATQIVAMGNKVLCLGTIAITNLSTDATQALSPEYIAQFTAGQVRGLNTNVLHTSQIAALSAQGISGLTSIQLINIGKRISSVSPDAIKGLTPTQITVLTVAQVIMLSASQIKALKKNHIAALSPEQVAVFSTAQIKALYNDSSLPPQYFSICIAMCFDFNINSLSKQQIIELGDDVQYLSANVIAKLSREAIQAIEPKYISQFTKEQLNALNTKALRADQIAAISAQAIAGLSPKQLRQMGTAIANLSIEAIQALTNEQLFALSEEQTSILAKNNASAFLILSTPTKNPNNCLPTSSYITAPPPPQNDPISITIIPFIQENNPPMLSTQCQTLSNNANAVFNFSRIIQALTYGQLSSMLRALQAQTTQEENNQNSGENDASVAVDLNNDNTNTITDNAINTTDNFPSSQQEPSSQNSEVNSNATQNQTENNTNPIALARFLINAMANMGVDSSADTTTNTLSLQQNNFLAAIIINQTYLNHPQQ